MTEPEEMAALALEQAHEVAANIPEEAPADRSEFWHTLSKRAEAEFLAWYEKAYGHQRGRAE